MSRQIPVNGNEEGHYEVIECPECGSNELALLNILGPGLLLFIIVNVVIL